MRSIVDDLKDLGATMVAVTPQVADFNQEMIRKHKIAFDMLSDPGNAYTAQLGLVFRVAQGVLDIYDEFGIDLAGSNGEDSMTLPMPCRLVVDTGGIVRAADIHPNHTQRPEPDKTVADVRALG